MEGRNKKLLQTFAQYNLALRLQNNIDIFLSLILSIGGAVIILLSYYATLGQYGIGIAFLCAPVGYNIIRKNYGLFSTSRNCDSSDDKKTKLLLLDISFLIAYTISLIILYSTVYYRPWYYFLLVAAAFTALILQSLLIKYNLPNLIFFFGKLLLLSLSFRAGRFFAFPEIPGADTHFHLRQAAYIQEWGSIPPYDLAAKYAFTPFWHIFESIQMIVLNAGMAVSLFVIASATLIAITFLAYSIGADLFNFRVGLVASVFVNIGDMVFVKTLSNIDTSLLVMVYFLVLVLCFHRSKKTFYCLSALMVFCMFWTHQLSIFAVYLALLGYYIGTLVFKNIYSRNYIRASGFNSDHESESKSLPYPNTLFLTLFSIYMIFFWSLIGNDGSGTGFFGSMVERLQRTLSNIFQEYLSLSELRTTDYARLFSSYDLVEAVLYNLGFSLLFCLALIGMLFVLKHYFDQKKVSLIFAIGLLFLIIYPGTYIGLNLLFIPHRFIPFLQLLFIMLSAFALVLLYNSTSLERTRVLLTLFVFVMIFLLVTAPYINRNDPIYGKSVEYRTEAVLSELTGISWGQMTAPDGLIEVDPRMTKEGLSTVEIVPIDSRSISFYGKDSGYEPIYIRDYIWQDPQFQLGGTFGLQKEYDYSEYLKNVVANNRLVYNNGDSKIYAR